MREHGPSLPVNIYVQIPVYLEVMNRKSWHGSAASWRYIFASVSQFRATELIG